MRKSIAALLFAASVAAAPAAILLNDTFTYTNGPLVTVSGGKWAHTSGTASEMQVVSAMASLSSTNSEDVSASLAGQPYPSGGPTNVFFASFTLRCSTLPTAGGTYFAHFDGSAFRGRVWALLGGATAGKFRLGLSSTNQNDPTVTNTATELSTNTDYLIVVRLTNSTGASKLWINPTAEADAGIETAETNSTSTVTSFAMRESTGEGSLTMDNVLVGTSFFEVVTNSSPVAPTINAQPQSQSTIEGGTVTFTVTATGLPAPTYQWQFASTNLPNATNASLTLTGVTTGQAGNYQVIVTNSAGGTNSAIVTLTVIVPNTNGTLSLVHYNVKGNFASDWTTNAAQVQAIARELQYLNPDIILLNEIPNGLQHEMTNWMTAFFPTYNLAISPNGDTSLRSGVICRYPITRTQSWLNDASLTNFGYNGTYTRDLFEAQLTVPGATEPLHVFTTHLKSAEDGDSQDRRAAECSAVSNFFATVFIPTNGWRPYLLTGDLNEDIAIPMSHDNKPIQRLISAPTGLQLTTPVNPFTGLRYTHSIQGTLEGSLDARFDYIMPAGVLASNIVTSQVFRTDKLPSPPPPLMTNDDIVASDHLPVQMIFNYPDPPLRAAITTSNQTVTVNWPALIGRRFNVESSTNLTGWSVAMSNVTALSGHPTWTTSTTNGARFYRVVRVP